MTSMDCSDIVCRPIGVAYTDHHDPQKTPIQPVYAQDKLGRIEIFPEYAGGLRDLEGFSHIYVLYHLHRAGEPKLTVKPFLQDVEHGVFATRSPCRPNGIGLSIVELVMRQRNVLFIRGVDLLDQTPVLDIKPYVPRFDHVATTRNGWQDEVDEETAQARGTRRENG